MISIDVDKDKTFLAAMKNLIDYSIGFIEGAERGKTEFLRIIGEQTKEVLGAFVDSNARIDPSSYHHIYEWYHTGSPESRLFDITYTISNLGLSMKSNFTQSTSIKEGAKEPFYDKASMMEAGVSIRVAPKNSDVLRFEVDGQEVFTRNSVIIPEAGGSQTTGAFGSLFDSFFQNYFSQSFLQSSGIRNKISNPVVYKKNLSSGLKGGKSIGITTGYRWVTNLGVDIV